MLKRLLGLFILVGVIAGICFMVRANAASPLVQEKKDPMLMIPGQKTDDDVDTLVLAGGCFWGMQGVFEHVKGVEKVVAGYAGGPANKAHYDMVSTGLTGHAESVKITYYPSKVKLDQLLDVFFKVAHNPTELNYQGPDQGTQYRSALFFKTDKELKAFKDKIKELKDKQVFKQPIVTTLEQLRAFYPAEKYHQDYMKNHPYQPYIMMYDAPKLEKLQKTFPDLYVK